MIARSDFNFNASTRGPFLLKICIQGAGVQLFQLSIKLEMLNIINYEELQRVIDLMEDNGNCEIERLRSIFPGKVKVQIINEHSSTFIFEGVSKLISTIVVGCQDGKICSITFYGEIEISPEDLYSRYKIFSDSYSYRDDLHFYIFNEDKAQGNYILPFFEPSHEKIDVERNNNNLSNVTIAWPRT